MAFDFETAPDEQYRDEARAALDPHKAHIVGISFSVAEGSGIYIPLTHLIGRNAGEPAALWDYLAAFFADRTVVKIAHNLAFEAMFLYARGIVIQAPVYDTIAAAQLTLNGNTTFRTLSDSGLKTLVPDILDISLPTFGEVTGDRHFDELNPADAETVRYACADSDYTLRLYHIFNDGFDKWMPKHRYIVEHIESPTAVYVGIMKHNGLLVDRELMERRAAECEDRLIKLREDIAFIIGDINIGANASTSAFKNYLYKDLGLPVLKTTVKFQEAADEETLILLAEWCAENRPDLVDLFRLIQEYRKVGKMKSTYIDGYAKYINTATGRIHADLMPLATETGRFAARNPNLQNMPRSGADEVGVRNFFTAPEGKVLLSLDFSQIELRVGAFYCRDENIDSATAETLINYDLKSKFGFKAGDLAPLIKLHREIFRRYSENRETRCETSGDELPDWYETTDKGGLRFLPGALADHMAKNVDAFFGAANAGKSTLLSIAQDILLGAENVSNIPWQYLGERFNKAELFGKLANIFADLPSKAIEDNGIFKSLTGEDAIQGERKGKDPFYFRPYARMLFSCNDIPKNFSDRSDGFYRKLIIIRFEKSVPMDKRDPNLRERIACERDGILSWALAGVRRLIANSYIFSETDRTRTELQRYKIESNSH